MQSLKFPPFVYTEIFIISLTCILHVSMYESLLHILGFSESSYEINKGLIITPILKIKKLRFRDGK